MSKNIFGIEEPDGEDNITECKDCVFDYDKYCVLNRFSIYDDTQNCTQFIGRNKHDN